MEGRNCPSLVNRRPGIRAAGFKHAASPRVFFASFLLLTVLASGLCGVFYMRLESRRLLNSKRQFEVVQNELPGFPIAQSIHGAD